MDQCAAPTIHVLPVFLQGECSLCQHSRPGETTLRLAVIDLLKVSASPVTQGAASFLIDERQPELSN
jgi:hypothetical protein